MKIELTEEQFTAIRSALIVSRVELEYHLKHAKKNESDYYTNCNKAVNEALEASEWDKVKVTF